MNQTRPRLLFIAVFAMPEAGDEPDPVTVVDVEDSDNETTGTFTAFRGTRTVRKCGSGSFARFGRSA